METNSSIKRRLINNFLSLSSIQLVSYLLPLITIPYLVRVLGVEKFGLVAFAQTVIQFLVVFTDYGFGLSATKEIAENKNDQSKLNIIFSSVMVVKAILLIIGFILLTLFIFSFDRFSEHWKLYYLTFGIVLGQSLFPVWYFQGIEKMHITAIANIAPKIIFTISIFIFVKSKEDFLYIPLINSLGFVISGALTLWLAIRLFKIKPTIPKTSQLKHQIVEGWHIFIGGLSTNFSQLSTTFILGLLTNNTMVGYYAAIEKVIRPIAALNRPIINAIFPYFANTAKTNPAQASKFIKKITLFTSVSMFVLGLLLFIFSEQFVTILFGEEYMISSTVLKIMAIIPMLNSFIHIHAIPHMIVFNFKRAYSKIMLIGFISNILLSLFLVRYYSVIGAATVTIVSDIVILSAMFLYLKKHQQY